MKKYLIFMVFFLGACSVNNGAVQNPFSTSTEVTSVYVSQFPDVPIPMDMNSDVNETLTTISSSGEKVGKETFSGRVDPSSLGAAMAHNLNSQGWTMLGIVQSGNTLQLYQKNSRYLIVTITDGAFSTNMILWMLSKQSSFGQDVLNLMNNPSSNNQDFDSFGSDSLFQ